MIEQQWQKRDHLHPHLNQLEQSLQTQFKTKEPPQENPPKQNLSKAAPPLEPRVIVAPVVPVDQSEDQAPLYQPNQPNQLPDIPPN